MTVLKIGGPPRVSGTASARLDLILFSLTLGLSGFSLPFYSWPASVAFDPFNQLNAVEKAPLANLVIWDFPAGNEAVNGLPAKAQEIHRIR